MMVWEAFWGSRGVFRELWGMPWGPSRASRSTQKGFQIHLRTLMGLVSSLLGATDGLGTVISSFGASRNGF